jgi:cell division cycle 20-like protein 1 (cofactor of APC complex)
MYDCILAAGLSCGSIGIFDLEKSKNIRTIYSHSERTSALTFIDDLLISGSKDTSIMVHDLRL